MIGNKYLQDLFECPDMDTGLNQLLELLKAGDKDFITSLNAPVDINTCSDDERVYLTIISALIDYCLQINEIDVPDWLRDEELCFEKPWYYSDKLSDFDRFKLLYSCTAPFRARNVYFDMNGIRRV